MFTKLLTTTLLLGIITLNQPLIAHEGHNHDKPTTIKAPKGGVVKALDKSRVEVVSKGSNIKIFLYDKEMNQAPAVDYKIKAQIKLPRVQKTQDISFSLQENHYEANYDVKKTHRFTLMLAVTDPANGHTYDLTFNIEPRK